jgi:hypothetical protein
LKPGQPRFECLECEDFTQCKACADMKDHPHKMKKFVVPKGCEVNILMNQIKEKPPSDKEISKIVENMKFCAECNYKFTEFDSIFQNKKNKDFMVCEECFKAKEREYKITDFEHVKFNYSNPY